MIIAQAILPFLFFLEPVQMIDLDKTFNRVEIYNDRIYMAPFTGNSIFVVTDSISNAVLPIIFTDDTNYRIYDFYITPFAIYLNNGKSIEKYYPLSGVKENIHEAGHISSMVVTPFEEIIYFDDRSGELRYLDFTFEPRLVISDLLVKDLDFADSLVHVLTRRRIISYDSYGNIIQEIDVPEPCLDICSSDSLLLLTPGYVKYLYSWHDEWIRHEFSHGIKNIALGEHHVFILDENGSVLYLYNKSAF